jgi:signal transduction histidine kinase/CheY-like chemotaxis protein
MVLVAGYGLVLGCIGLLSRMRGNHVARFFLLAWVFPLLGMLYTDLMFLGILPFTDVGYSAMNIATLLEAILLSMALADRINMLRVQRQRAVVDAKQKLEMSNRALEKANRLKDSFLGTISHELRTPMNGIIGTLELLKSTSVDQHQRECLTTLEHSSAHMLSMVERILLFSELQSGSVRVQTSALEVATWRQKIKQTWTPMFTAKGLRFSIYIDAACSDWVSVDTKKLDYLINELLSNALKFTSQGDVTLEIQQKNTGTEAQWMLEVTDNGVGIPAEQLQLITESFRQGQSTYNRQYGGLGIGMAICKELVTALNGEWRVQSAQGAGTRISIVIPVVPVTMPVIAPTVSVQTATPATPQSMPKDVTAAPGSVTAPASAIDVMPHAGTKEGVPLVPTSAAALKPPAILVVEDNAVNQMVMKKILESLGWTYCIANNGVEAVEKAREKPFALILMDCQMPVMDGFAATESIRAGDNLNQATPIVAVTANATDQDRDHCMASGMNDYLKKPFKPNDIKRIIDLYVASDALVAAGQSG